MPINKFFQLLNLIKKPITKQNTNWLKSISAEECLAVFLRYVKNHSILLGLWKELNLSPVTGAHQPSLGPI